MSLEEQKARIRAKIQQLKQENHIEEQLIAKEPEDNEDNQKQKVWCHKCQELMDVKDAHYDTTEVTIKRRVLKGSCPTCSRKLCGFVKKNTKQNVM